MSGPKISEIELEQRRQAEIERQRQERLRKIKIATDAYVNITNQYEEFNSRVFLALQDEVQYIMSVRELGLDYNTFKAIQEKTISEVKQQLSLPLPTEPEEIQLLNENLRKIFLELEKAYKNGLADFSDRLALHQKGKEDQAQLNDFIQALSKIEREEKHEYSDVRFDLISTKVHEGKIEDEGIEVLIDECLMLINNSAVSQNEAKLLMGLMRDMHESKRNCYVVTFCQ